MIFFVVFAALFILLVPASQPGPGHADGADGQLPCCLPFVLVFVMRLSADKELMGSARQRQVPARDRLAGNGAAGRSLDHAGGDIMVIGV
jgi:hypothetical protein